MGISETLGGLFTTLWILALLYYAGLCVFNVYFHSLKDYPGPLIGRASLLYSSYLHVVGGYPHRLRDLHARYGSVVRIRPNELSYISAQAWQDIYGPRTGDDERPDFEKDESAFSQSRKIYTIMNAPNRVHGRLRRLMSHAFSEEALLHQESVVQSYTSQLIEQLRARAQDSTKYVQDITTWLNFTTFDITGDLLYGESFHGLERGTMNPWISNLFNTIKIGSFLRIANLLPILARMPILYWIYRQFPKDAVKHRENERKKVEQRLSKGITDRRDFIDEMLANNDGNDMTHEEITTSSTNLILGGSETTASLLSGAVFYLVSNKSVMKKLSKEILETFESDEGVTFQSVSSLEYLSAVLQETLRLYPPVGNSLPRFIPEPGYVIDGKFVSGGTIVGIQPFAANHSPRNFEQAERFLPERWLRDTQFKDDKRGVLQPFSIGPRDCIGKRLAWCEMRIILARLLLNFDLKLLDQSSNWLNQKNRVVWEKPALYIEVFVRK